MQEYIHSMLVLQCRVSINFPSSNDLRPAHFSPRHVRRVREGANERLPHDYMYALIRSPNCLLSAISYRLSLDMSFRCSVVLLSIGGEVPGQVDASDVVIVSETG